MSFSCCGPSTEVGAAPISSFALAGNPNVGKSSIFNTLTGTGAVTANYPGKTVEINVAEHPAGGPAHRPGGSPGHLRAGGRLRRSVGGPPGHPRRQSRRRHRDPRRDEPDAKSLHAPAAPRHGVSRVVAALNLCDQAKKKGIEIDVTALSKVLGIPVVPTVATHGEGLQAMLGAAVSAARAAQGESALDRNAGRPTSRRRYDWQDIEQSWRSFPSSSSAF